MFVTSIITIMCIKEAVSSVMIPIGLNYNQNIKPEMRNTILEELSGKPVTNLIKLGPEDPIHDFRGGMFIGSLLANIIKPMVIRVLSILANSILYGIMPPEYKPRPTQPTKPQRPPKPTFQQSQVYDAYMVRMPNSTNPYLYLLSTPKKNNSTPVVTQSTQTQDVRQSDHPEYHYQHIGVVNIKSPQTKPKQRSSRIISEEESVSLSPTT